MHAVFLLAFAAAAAATMLKRLRFLDKFGALNDILMLASAGGVNRLFHIINGKVINGEMDTEVQQQRDANPPKQISNVDWEALKADKI